MLCSDCVYAVEHADLVMETARALLRPEGGGVVAIAGPDRTLGGQGSERVGAHAAVLGACAKRGFDAIRGEGGWAKLDGDVHLLRVRMRATSA